MIRTAKAVLCRELNKPVVVETISIDGPKRNEATVKIAACLRPTASGSVPS